MPPNNQWPELGLPDEAAIHQRYQHSFREKLTFEALDTVLRMAVFVKEFRSGELERRPKDIAKAVYFRLVGSSLTSRYASPAIISDKGQTDGVEYIAQD